MPLWARTVGEPRGGGIDGGGDRAGCAGRAHRAEEENGDAGGRATGHPQRHHPHHCEIREVHVLDRMIENVYFTYFAVVGMVSLWLPILFFARGALTDFL